MGSIPLNSSSGKRLTSVILVLLVTIGALFSSFQSSAQSKNEEIRRSQRAIYIFNFTQYFTWRNFDEMEVFTIGVLGNDPIYNNLLTMAESRTVRNKPIKILKFQRISDIDNVQLLYVNKEYNYDINDVISGIQGDNVLLVSENYLFNESMINVLDMDDVIQFELNENRLRREGFIVPSSLSKLAVSSSEVWQELYRQSEKSLSSEREKVAEQQKILDELSEQIKVQQASLTRQKTELNRQQKLIDSQKDSIDIQTAVIEEKLQQIDSVQADFVNKQLLLQGLEDEMKGQIKEMDAQQNRILAQQADISRQDSILINQSEFIDSQEFKISEQQTKIDTQENKLNFQRNFTYLFIGLFTLGLITSFFIFRGYRFKQKANEALAKKNKEIETQAIELAARNEEIQEFTSILRKREANLNSLLENTTDIIWSIDRDLELIAYNEAFQDVLENLTQRRPTNGGKLKFDLLPYEMEIFWEKSYERAFLGERFVDEWEMNLPDRIVTFELFFNPILEDGDVTGVSVFGRDISKRILENRQRERFQKSLELLNNLASKADIDFQPLMVEALELAINMLNMSFAAICIVDHIEFKVLEYSFSRDLEIKDKSFDMKDSLVSLIYNHDKLFSQSSLSGNEFTSYHSLTGDAESVIGNVIKVDHQKYGVVYFSDSATRFGGFDSYELEFTQLLSNWIASEIAKSNANEQLRLAKENAEAASNAKASFLSTITHEIRTPLNGIIGTSYLLLNKDPKPSQLEYIKMLKYSGENLLSIVNDVLDYNKIEQGKLELEVVDMNLRELTESIVNTAKIAADEKDIAVNFEYDAELKDFYGGDPTRISQVVNNLVTNAIKFTSKGSVTIKVTKEEPMGGGDKVKMEVIDTGIGIKDEMQSRIFEEFTQADTSTSREFGGSGLGLAICQNLLRLMKSKIHLKSKFGEGSNFYFSLSLPYSDAQAIMEQQEGVFSEAKDLNGVNILLAEDNKYNMVIAKDFLNSWGAEVTTAMDGKQALESAKSKEFDLILMDLQMPIMDGYEATESIRSLEDPYFQEIPILALSASTLSRVKAKAMSAGMNGFITKPFNPEDFFGKVREHSVASVELVMDNQNTPLHKNAGGAQDIIEKYMELFVKSMEESIVGLDEAIKKKDGEQIEAITHKVKSGLRYVGQNQLADRAEFFEESLINGTDISELLSEVENYLVDLVKAVDSVKSKLGDSKESA